MIAVARVHNCAAEKERDSGVGILPMSGGLSWAGFFDWVVGLLRKSFLCNSWAGLCLWGRFGFFWGWFVAGFCRLWGKGSRSFSCEGVWLFFAASREKVPEPFGGARVDGCAPLGGLALFSGRPRPKKEPDPLGVHREGVRHFLLCKKCLTPEPEHGRTL